MACFNCEGQCTARSDTIMQYKHMQGSTCNTIGSAPGQFGPSAIASLVTIIFIILVIFSPPRLGQTLGQLANEKGSVACTLWCQLG
jgi:hypothetical protein